MSESKHTPGPWSVSMNGSFETEVRSASGRRVAATWVQGPAKSREGALNQGKTNEANARLIAAAPDLLDVAKRLASLEHEDMGRTFPSKEDIAAARAAIARAEGRS